MKTNKILFVGAAFLMMISCDNNSISFDKIGDGDKRELSHVHTDRLTPISIKSTDISSSPSIKSL